MEGELGKLIRNEAEAIECLKKNKPTSGFYMLQEAVDMAVKALEDVQEYRAIGTVERFRELEEKAKPKVPISLDENGEYHECPICGYSAENSWGSAYRFCPNCGTEFDWNEGKE